MPGRTVRRGAPHLLLLKAILDRGASRADFGNRDRWKHTPGCDGH